MGKTANDFREGQTVKLLVATIGDNDDGEEVGYTPGATGTVILIEGGRVHVSVENEIVNVFEGAELNGLGASDD